MSQNNLFGTKPTWTGRRINQGDCRQYPEEINLDLLPRLELNCYINIYIIFSRE